ncbi:DUF1289 domain-containing protein [Shewanella sp. GXUN23E]|uniref:DUF1289 domain-containing protein n=1 Tax=Shewanella sp. GXUN23E TaxID=3422498 RepID=UPI003D7D2DFE
MRVPSPCVARCKLNEQDYCIGCCRHIDEIVSWSAADDQQRLAILQQLPARKAHILQDSEASACAKPIGREQWLSIERKLKS